MDSIVVASHLNMGGLEQIFFTIWSYLKKLDLQLAGLVSVFQFPQTLLLIIFCMEVARSRSSAGYQKWLQVRRYQLLE